MPGPDPRLSCQCGRSKGRLSGSGAPVVEPAVLTRDQRRAATPG